MATLIEYTWIASDTYDSRREGTGNWVAAPGPPPGWDYYTPQGQTRDPISGSYHYHASSDLEANTYFKGDDQDNPSEVVISFRGTEFDRAFSSLQDAKKKGVRVEFPASA